MEVNQEANKEEKHPHVRDVGKEIDQGHSNDDDVIATLDKFLGDPQILLSVLSTQTFLLWSQLPKPNMEAHKKAQFIVQIFSNKEKGTDQGQSTRDDSPKTPQQRIIQKEIDQGPSDDISSLDELLRTPEILRCLISTSTMQKYLPLGRSHSNPITLKANLVTRSALSKQSLRDLIGFLRRFLASTPTKPKLASMSVLYKPDYSTTYSIYPSTTTTPTSRQSIYMATRLVLVPSTPIEHPIIASTTATPALALRISTSDDGGEDERMAEQISKEVKVEFLIYAPKEFPEVPKDLARQDRRILKPEHAIRELTIQATPAPALRISTSDDGGEDERMVEQISKEVKVDFLIYALKEIPEVPKDLARQDRRILKREHAIRELAIQAHRPRRELAKVWKELLISKEQEQVDKRWSIQAELAKLFNTALKFSYPELDENCFVLPCIEMFGDYTCENVLTIWPKLRGKGRTQTHQGGPRRVGWKIKRNIELIRPQMLEREPWVLDVGFVSIKLSGKWMAKSVHKMLKDGIDTWAPKILMESVIVNFPSYNTDLMPIDLLRRHLITKTLFNMLQYSKIPVNFSMPPDEVPIEERDDGVLIFRNAEGELEIHVKRDGCCGNPVKDLTDLWYGLEKKKADWIVCVTPVQQQEYIKTCIKAAQHANWLPRDWSDSPRASFTGYQTFNTEMKHENLDPLLNKAKVICIVAANKLGYNGEQVSNCALKYTILKNDRLADYTFNFQEMLNAEGNTFVYLLNTRARIRSFIESSCEDIDKPRKTSGLQLGKGEIWKEGVERVLVQHLLRFTKVIEDSCLPVLPHILCEYLYDLSKNFNRCYVDSSICVESSICEETKLLLCEATEVVMKKGFQLLGITPESSSLGEDWPQASSSLILIERLNHRDPPKIKTRFELFSFIPHVTRDPSFETGKLFGQIAIFDTYNVLSDGWGPTTVPDHGFIALFDCDWPDAMDITNHYAVDFGNPGSRNLVPFSSLMEVRVELYASTDENDALFELSDSLVKIDCAKFLEEDDAICCLSSSKGSDGLVRMYYILLKDAIDSTIRVTYHPKKDCGEEVYGEIFAHYGSGFFGEHVDPVEKEYYTATLLRSNFDCKIMEIPLDRCRLAVPRKGSIVIVTRLWDDSGFMILDDCFTFNAPHEDKDSKEEKMNVSHTLRVRVDWSGG